MIHDPIINVSTPDGPKTLLGLLETNSILTWDQATSHPPYHNSQASSPFCSLWTTLSPYL